MTKLKFSKPSILLAVALLLAITPGVFTQVLAESESVSSSNRLRDVAIAGVTFEPPGGDKPADSAGGASRGEECSQAIGTLSNCVIPLMPSTQTGLTVAPRPTFFAYIPQTTAKEMFFSLIDQNNRSLYQTKVPLTGKAGIVRVQLPDNIPALEVGQKYRWTFIMIGEQGLRPDSPGVQGSIQRVAVDSNLRSELENKALVEQAAVFGKKGIWYDTLTTLANAMRSPSANTNLTMTWQELLQSVGLGEISTEPLLN